MTLEDALENARAADARGEPRYQKIADTYGVDRSTLSRRHRGVQGSMHQKIEQQQNLTNHEELERCGLPDSSPSITTRSLHDGPPPWPLNVTPLIFIASTACTSTF
jgi:hypothetical protein